MSSNTLIGAPSRYNPKTRWQNYSTYNGHQYRAVKPNDLLLTAEHRYSSRRISQTDSNTINQADVIIETPLRTKQSSFTGHQRAIGVVGKGRLGYEIGFLRDPHVFSGTAIKRAAVKAACAS